MTYLEWLETLGDERWNIGPMRAYDAGYSIAVKYLSACVVSAKMDGWMARQPEIDELCCVIEKMLNSWGSCDYISDDEMEQDEIVIMARRVLARARAA